MSTILDFDIVMFGITDLAKNVAPASLFQLGL
jgi:hypothetical protein